VIGYDGLVADGCERPGTDALLVYAWRVCEDEGEPTRPARPCRPCRWMLGRMRAEAREAAREDLARSLRSAHCVVVGVL
jgi:hypothetical protein